MIGWIGLRSATGLTLLADVATRLPRPGSRPSRGIGPPAVVGLPFHHDKNP